MRSTKTICVFMLLLMIGVFGIEIVRYKWESTFHPIDECLKILKLDGTRNCRVTIATGHPNGLLLSATDTEVIQCAYTSDGYTVSWETVHGRCKIAEFDSGLNGR